MRVLIKEVKPNVIDREDPNKITSFWIYGLFKNGREIKIFDSEVFDLRKYENQELNLLIFCKLSNIPDDAINVDELYFPVLEGKYLGEFKISDKWEIGWRFEPIKKENPTSFHAIQTEDGILVIKPKSLKYYSIKPGDHFKFKVVGFDLIAWEPIDGEREVDPLAYEKNFIKKFWNLLESTREKCNKNAEIQKKLIYKELLNWIYDDIWLFGDILNYLMIQLRFNKELRRLLEGSISKWADFYRGIIALGRKQLKDALLTPSKFFQDLKAGIYAESPKKIESSLYTLVQDVVEEKSGKPIEVIQDYYIRKDIDDLQKRICHILNDEFEIDYDKTTSQSQPY